MRARIVRKHVTKEGELLDFYQEELALTIDGCDDRIVLLWPTLVCHQINEKSPLYNMSELDFQRDQFEILVMLEGGDDNFHNFT
jgi:Inward rectifier potassium channel C-terminal domain